MGKWIWMGALFGYGQIMVFKGSLYIDPFPGVFFLLYQREERFPASWIATGFFWDVVRVTPLGWHSLFYSLLFLFWGFYVKLLPLARSFFSLGLFLFACWSSWVMYNLLNVFSGFTLGIPFSLIQVGETSLFCFLLWFLTEKKYPSFAIFSS